MAAVNPEAAERVFGEALERIFSNWTLLALAVEQNWAGRDTRARRQQLFTEIGQHLAAGAARRRPPSHENEDDVQDFADLLYQRLVALFYVEAEDDSEEEVARLILQVFNACRTGDEAFMQQFLQRYSAAGQDLSRCQGVDVTQYATEEEKELAGIGGGDDDGMMGIDEGDEGSSSDDDLKAGGAGAGTGAAGGYPLYSSASSMEALAASIAAQAQQAPAQAPARPPREEPVVDDDGFTMVPARGRRR
eukprot:gnl/TRDRNA2_/TRDRNA2_189589_c0_seq1.p1 gnl/TRDRNA2_/TRDRNA2_189589_c0~~gnl/TRDRNA2_/TRDRNA2_189589_c0_seq1.p1  ORF type:complete len:275 (+),score=67.23 gnl/TRDRNA2_/TRDRNA2_189589_c0_seq1:84-827(+)